MSIGSKLHTLLDIPTTFRQICGRLRDAPKDKTVNFIFSHVHAPNVTYKEFKTRTMKSYREALDYCTEINGLKESSRQIHKQLTTYTDSEYIKYSGDKLVVNADRLRYEIEMYRRIQVYSRYEWIIDELKQNDFDIKHYYIMNMDKNYIKLLTGINTRQTFQELFDKYCLLMRSNDEYCLGILEAERISASRPLVKEAYDLLGEQEVKKLKYHVSNIRRQVEAKLPTPMIEKVVNECRRTFPVGRPIPHSEIKKSLQEIYNGLGVSHTARATDILEWCEVIDSSMYPAGKKVRCYTIVRYKLVRSKK